jgi:hypothetical protein
LSFSQQRLFVDALELQNQAVSWMWKGCGSLGGVAPPAIPLQSCLSTVDDSQAEEVYGRHDVDHVGTQSMIKCTRP